MAKNKSVDWEKLKIEYVTGHISQRDLAAKYSVPYSTIRTRSIKEKWVEEKKQHGSTVVANAKKKIAKKQSDILAREYQIANDFVKLIEKSLNDKKSYNEVSVSFGNVTETGRIDAKAILNAANALQKFMEIKRVCKGHQTIQEIQQHELALKRLEIEEKRAQKDDNIDNELHILIDSEDADKLEKWKN